MLKTKQYGNKTNKSMHSQYHKSLHTLLKTAIVEIRADHHYLRMQNKFLPGETQSQTFQDNKNEIRKAKIK
jgi:hypothetical protein